MNLSLDKKARYILPVVAVICGIGVLVMVSNLRGTLDDRGYAQTNNQTSTKTELTNYAPILQNVPAQIAYVGDLYSFSMNITDSDTPVENLSATLLQGPSWLNYSQFMISGTPSSADITNESGSKVVLQITDGKNTVDKSYYLVVKFHE